MQVPQYINTYTRERILDGTTDPDIAKRIIVEGRIMMHAAKTLTKAGYEIRVFPGREDDELPFTSDPRAVMEESMCCDEDVWAVRRNGIRCGHLLFVQGNDGYDVLSDWSWQVTEDGEAFNELAETVMRYAERFDV